MLLTNKIVSSRIQERRFHSVIPDSKFLPIIYSHLGRENTTFGLEFTRSHDPKHKSDVYHLKKIIKIFK
ncbi:hypothetical protein BpHYR1_034995 [Brachionus plicatilis]|uniref:Uncharacterized protein n=1 Tax=Brachionus plicatilis TaxID=10195 RepID=A0A3M7R8W1_BRAPC|nr:hypothetical protein BpHYR1_034995 [Brachionus plicatilis]